MSCDFDREKIATYLDGECDPAVRGMVVSHLEGCGECRSLLDAFAENDAALKAADSAPVPDGYWDSYESRLLARLRLAESRPASKPQPFLPRVILAALAAAAVFAITIGLAIQTGRDRGSEWADESFEDEVVSGKGGPTHGKGGGFEGKGGPDSGPVAAQTKGDFDGQSSANVVTPQQTAGQSQTMFWGANDVPTMTGFLTVSGASAPTYSTLLVGCQQVMSQTVATDLNDPAQMESLQSNICETGLLDQVSSERPSTLAPDVKTKLFQAQVVFTSLANCTYDVKPDLGEFQVVRGSIVSNGLGSWTGQSAQAAATASDVIAYQGAFNLLVQGQCAPAASAFSVFAQDYPASPFIDKAAYWRGFSHVECGNYGKAIEILKVVPEQHPKSRYADDALYKVGEVYERYMHDYENALKTYQEVVAKYPDSCVAVQSLQRNAQICEQKNDYAGAVDNWSVSLKKAEGLPFGNRMQTKQSLQNRLPENYFSRVAASRVAFIRAHADGDYVPLTRYTDAQTLARRGETDQAIEKYRALLGDCPKCSLVPYARLELAECLVRQGRESDALLLLEQVRSVAPPEDLAVRYKELMLRVQERSLKQEQQAK